MKIYLGSDHAGFALKEQIKEFLTKNMYEVVDCGAEIFDAQDDYPDFITPVAQVVAQDAHARVERFGIVFGGSGQGEMMAANRVAGVRCAMYYGGTDTVVVLSREHNNANMLSLGARLISEDQAREVINKFLSTSFSDDERHLRRLSKF